MHTTDLTKTRLRYLVLCLASLTCFGSYFIYDIPSVLQPQLQTVSFKQSLSLTDFEFNLFYSVYSFPNIILPFFGGYLVDTIGPRTCTSIFAVLVAIGQSIFAFGITLNSYPIALIGRAVFGIAGESLNVGINYFITGWFSGKELSMGIGTTVSVARLGSVANDNTEPLMVQNGSLSLGVWVGFLICLLSMICAVALSFIDLNKDRKLGIKEKFHLPADEKFKFSDIRSFGFCFWCICLNCFAVYIDVSCFNNIASKYFQKRFGYSMIEAGSIISITYLVAALLCPIFGIFVDRFGKRSSFIVCSAVAVALVHVAFIFTPDSHRPVYPIFYMVVLGLGYSIYASVIWASIPFLIDAKATGTAFGTALAVQNLGLAIGPIIVGLIQESSQEDKGYYWVSFFFIVVGVVGIGSSIAIYVYDNQKGGVLKQRVPKSFLSNRDKEKELMIIN